MASPAERDASWSLRVYAILGLIVGAPAAFLGLAMPINEYDAMGIVGADCDGPLHVAMWAVPGLVACVVGTAVFGRDALRRRTVASSVVAISAALVSIGLLARLWSVHVQMHRPEHVLDCGDDGD